MHRGAFLIIACIFLFSCSDPVSSPGDKVTATDQEQIIDRGIVHWKSFLTWDEETITEAADSRLAIFPISICLSEAGEEIIRDLKTLNPDLKIIGYLGMLSITELFADTATVLQNTPFEMDLHLIARSHWAWTTTGDTLSMWPGSIFLNPFTDGELDYDFIEDLVDLIETYQADMPICLDGIMHDYFMYRPYIAYGFEDVITGDIDLDGNGILVADDAIERENFLRWQIDYAAEISERMGSDFIQIGNGRVPQENAELAGVLNGIFYEVFPNMRWGLTDREGFQLLLQNQQAGYLSEACGRTWSILTNDAVEYNNYFCLVSSLLAECLYTEIYDRPVFSGWRLDVTPGSIRSDLITEGSEDSILTYSRLYSRGEARISFADYGGRIETDFIQYNTD